VGSRVVVVGSLNVDLVLGLDRMPNPGETVFAHSMHQHPGGKGLNQAVACARSGAEVSMLGAVGDDASGEWLREVLTDNNINAQNIMTIPGPSGTALIEVEDGGENRIVVVSGANRHIPAQAITQAIRDLPDVGILLVQGEVTLDVIKAALTAARERGALTILNPSPVADFPPDLIKLVDVIIPNEHEAAQLTGLDTSSSVDATEAAQRFNELGVGTAIITRGGKGCVWASGPNSGSVATFRVQPVDTVGAGDAFCGGLAAALSFGMSMSEALRWASATGALSTTKHGAVPSLPYRDAVEELLEANS
jgi:ribokinase